MNKLDNCKICPHECGVNRNKGEQGRCKCNDKIKIALASIHQYEEPCISGENDIKINIACIVKIMKLAKMKKGKR